MRAPQPRFAVIRRAVVASLCSLLLCAPALAADGSVQGGGAQQQAA